MARGADQVEVYIESGESKSFAVALDALFTYGPRYARVLAGTKLGFVTPTEETTLVVVERLTGTMTTNFGAPDRILDRDSNPVEPGEMERWQEVMRACWRAIDEVAKAAAGRELTKGPRGGGRDLDKVMEHIQGGEESYLTALGGKAPRGSNWQAIREAILTTLAASARGEIAERGPRGGVRWPPRYFVRRLAWHDLDHVWEIEDGRGYEEMISVLLLKNAKQMVLPLNSRAIHRIGLPLLAGGGGRRPEGGWPAEITATKQ